MPSILPLHALLGHKRADFTVRIELHELINVPLVTGKFRTKWRIDHSTHASVADDASSISSGPETLVQSRGGAPALSLSSPQSANPSRFDYDYHDSTYRSSSRPPTATYDSRATLSSSQNRASSPRQREQSQNGRRDSHGAHEAMDESEHSQDAHGNVKQEAKGYTQWKPVTDHIVKLRRVIHCTISIPLARHGRVDNVLQPCYAKFIVYESLPVGPNGEQQDSRMGNIVIDLAHFVARRNAPPPRELKPARYLLQDCKSNAVLRMTVQVSWTGGERTYELPSAPGARMTTSGSHNSLLGVLSGNKSSSQLTPDNSSQQSLNDDSSRNSQHDSDEHSPNFELPSLSHQSTHDDASRLIDDLINDLSPKEDMLKLDGRPSGDPVRAADENVSPRSSNPDSPRRRRQPSTRSSRASKQSSLDSGLGDSTGRNGVEAKTQSSPRISFVDSPRR